MKPREKLLVAMVGLGLVILTGFGASRFYSQKTQGLAIQKKYELDKLKHAKEELEAAKAREKEWRDVGKQTLSVDLTEAKGLFRTELVKLAAQCDMPIPGTQIEMGIPRPLSRSGITILGANIKAEGSVDRLVRLMFELHRQPFLIRYKNLELKPVMNKPSSPGAPVTPTGRIALSVYVETPILPADTRVPKLEVARLAPGQRVPVGRPLLASVEGYRGIREELFEPHVEPPTNQAGSGKSSGESAEVGTEEGGSVPPERVDAGLVLARVLSSPRSQQAVLVDPENPNALDRRVEVGSSLYEGTLIFVHPTGAVVEKDGERTFHVIGQPLRQGRVLDAAQQPEVSDALERLEKRLATAM
jgi:hypothetical protein